MKTPSSLSSVIFALAACASLMAGDENPVQTLVSVRTAKVVRATLRSEVLGFGTVEGAPASGPSGQAGGAILAAATSGLVVKVLVAEGAHVERDALLVQMDTRSADAALSKARASLELARKAHARQLAMKSAGGASERSLLEASASLAAAEGEVAAAELTQSQLGIRSPLSGVVGRLSARPGEWLEGGKAVAEIIDPSNLVVTAQVSAQEAAKVQPGARAAVHSRLGRDDGEIAKGKVAFVSPLTARESDSVVVRIGLEGDSRLRAGRLVVARIVTEEREGCLAVPAESLVEADGATVVSIVSGGVAKQVPVKVGLRDRGLAEVTGEGITLGSHSHSRTPSRTQRW